MISTIFAAPKSNTAGKYAVDRVKSGSAVYLNNAFPTDRAVTLITKYVFVHIYVMFAPFFFLFFSLSINSFSTHIVTVHLQRDAYCFFIIFFLFPMNKNNYFQIYSVPVLIRVSICWSLSYCRHGSFPLVCVARQVLSLSYADE
jgi:hypothetical protein